jgi:spore coat polysaccharide biosynthesis protein SpsF
VTTGKALAIIQARAGSTRLPKKVLQEISGHPMLWHVIERTKRCKSIGKVIVATTTLAEDDAVEGIAKNAKIACFRGDVHDVLGRYYLAAKDAGGDIVVRITADCPLIHPETVDRMVDLLRTKKADYACLDPSIATFETGVEAFTFKTLFDVYEKASEKRQKEHVTLYIRENPERFKIALLKPDPLFQRKDLRVTVDTAEDLQFMSEVYNSLYKEGEIVDLKKVLDWIEKNPTLKEINAHVKLSEVNKYAQSEKMRKKLLQAAE